jgi:hypothetical protein
VKEFANLGRKVGCRYILEDNFKKYGVKKKNMKIELTDSGQTLLISFCEHDNKTRDPSNEGIHFIIL